ncbi:MAG: hypothetical protein HOI47_09340 [Candidatus Scalindua sp.]|nr:hypothetical protein [Candidatus Scalindua sp.]
METETKINLLELLPKNFLQIIKEHIFEYNLYPYQLTDLLVELEDILFGHGNSLTRERARQTGKTASITILTLSCMTLFPALAQSEKYLKLFPSLHLFKDGFSIVIVAPKIDQAKITLRRLKGISQKKNYKKLMAELGIEVINKSLFLFSLSNGSSIVAMSGNPKSVTEGESAHLLIFDEAHQIVPYSWHKAYSPMVSSTNGTIVSFGISWTAKLSFYNQIQINKKLGLHSRIPYMEAQKYSKYYKKWIMNELSRIGKDSIEFQLNFLLVWLLKTTNPITPELWDDIDMLGDYKPGEITSDNLYVGIDWGKTHNNTFVTVVEKALNCLKMVDLLELTGDDYPQQHIAIQVFLNKYPRLKKIWSESTGVGDTNTDFLIAIFGSKVQPVTAYNLPMLHDKMLNEINYKRLIRPKVKDAGPWKSLTRQFLNCEKIYHGSSFKLVAPQGADEQDDAIDSCGLAVGAALNDQLFDFVYRKSTAINERLNTLANDRVIKSGEGRSRSGTEKHISNY